MQITINLDEDDVRFCKAIVADQTHFVLNSKCIQDAVISGILTQISKKNIPNIKGETDQRGFPHLKQLSRTEKAIRQAGWEESQEIANNHQDRGGSI
jgi:hypothetical protein|tara:strand:+ start:1459 stop:1749 length:291 start_codon:yes stop_codon:yes gene_type:complete